MESDKEIHEITIALDNHTYRELIEIEKELERSKEELIVFVVRMWFLKYRMTGYSS